MVEHIYQKTYLYDHCLKFENSFGEGNGGAWHGQRLKEVEV